MQYVILEADDMRSLVSMVNRAMADGWTPLGGVSVTETRTDRLKAETKFYQAMTRKAVSE